MQVYTYSGQILNILLILRTYYILLVNYTARDFGIKRHTTVEEALIKCPQLRLVHVPTYSVACSEGSENDELVAIPKYRDEIPAYRSDGSRLPPCPPDPASNKACLEPYRQASQAIFRLIRDWCGQQGEGILMEKGGLDEVFLDITEEVEQQLIDNFDQKYTMLRDECEEVDMEIVEENLKMYETDWIDQLDYSGLGNSAIKEFKKDENILESMRLRLGTLRIWKGAQIASSLRAKLRGELNFIASIGIAPNKMLAKLVSALYKPDQQTRIEPNCILEFMGQVPFEKIRMMGGKMGKSVLNEGNEEDENNDNDADFGFNENENSHSHARPSNSVMASDLWPLSIPELADRVGDRQTAAWIHQLIRGHDPSVVTPRSLTKSFMSAKSFRPAVRDWPELYDWLVVLVGELWSRMGEEKENSSRWPSNITIHFKAFQQQTRRSNNNWNNTGSMTKTCEFPYSSSIPSQAKRSDFLASAFKTLKTASETGTQLFPMSRLAVSVANFKSLEADGKAKATRVDHFFPLNLNDENVTQKLPASLDRFFPAKPPVTGNISKKPSISVLDMLKASASKPEKMDGIINETPAAIPKKVKTSKPLKNDISQYFSKTTKFASTFTCVESNCQFTCLKEDCKQIQEHSDHHLALKLSREP